MGKLVNIINPLHTSTSRNYIQRMTNEKVKCMGVAKQYGFDFWDGDRQFGYGGYKYDGRWKTVAEQLIDYYQLTNHSKILDVGCGKGYLLYEIKSLLPESIIHGFDASSYAIENSKEEIRDHIFYHKAQSSYPYHNFEFDLVISLTTLHNLCVYDLKIAITEIERVGKNKYIVVESYRNEQELFNLQCWALTCESFYNSKEWVWLFNEWDYSGDYEFIYFE